jgi:hypothetical protein
MQTTGATVTSWSEAVMTSLTGALAMFMAAIPKVIGFLVILIIGWFIAGLLASAVAKVLRAVRFNDLAQRSGFTDFVRNMGLTTDASGVLANIVKWFVRLIVLVVAFDALGLPAVSEVLQQFLMWIPNLVVAMIVLIIGGLAANALSRLVRGATAQAEFGNPDLIANIARLAVWAFAIVVAVNQIGIATTLVNTLFMGLVGALALALGLAFGLGGRDTAAQIVRNWYVSGQQAGARAMEATGRTQEQSRTMDDGRTVVPPAYTSDRPSSPPTGRVTQND